ncbi:MAG TPA: c-type cytochrome [Gemmataceae bacterium]|nr:c-type cytochrome [Gemmataceae bacterium]
MAATDQTYRSQKILDIVFAVSCILMLLSTLWMFWQDYDRQFKHEQREFRNVEEAMNEYQMLAQLPSPDQVAEARKKVVEARKNYEAKHDEKRAKERELTAKHDLADNSYRSIKADLDSKSSLYNIAVEHWGRETEGGRKQELDAEVKRLDKEVKDLQARLSKAQDELDHLDEQIYKEVMQPLAEPQQRLNQTEDDLKKLTAGFDRFAKVTAQKRWKFGDEFRRLPILDAFESPTKINQLWLPDLTIDYGGFKDVPRYDRCISCHLGIDRGSFDHTSLTRLTRSPGAVQKDIDTTLAKIDESERNEVKNEIEGMKHGPESDIKEKINSTRKEIAEEKEEDKKAALVRKRRLYEMALEYKTASAMEGRLKQAREILTEREKAGEKLGFDPSDLPRDVRWMSLSKAQIKEYAAHPRLDLFVDANSPHPMLKFGCTACHAGQGSATNFVHAAHTPADAEQEEEWHKKYGWEHSEFWDYPMLSSRFVESSCLKCHHEVTDLVRHGSKEEAPKLLRGYHLIQENGCFGCHEIASIKSGHEVGPDLRLEPQPALAYLTPAEQDRAKADPLNPPGQYRKVGPSLRRIAEKTNQEWVRKWVRSPRGFRPDTKMPHFYGLSNNSPDVLPDSQKRFPDTEIAGIAYYLLAESKGNLESDANKKDNARMVLEGVIHKRQDQLKKGLLQDRDWKELDKASRQLGDLALMSVPSQANEINRLLTSQKQAQEKLQELHKKAVNLQAQKEPEELSAGEQEELEQARKDLDAYTTSLLQAGQITPLAKGITDEEGKTVPLPKAGDAAKGRKLFSERGCLACHSHDGTTKPGDGVGVVDGKANFGPNLSRIAAKIAPEIADEKGMAEAKRRWVVQWLLNPTIYHPRTRMPITHLTPQDAADVAEWLLSQNVTDWDEKGPQEPTREDLVLLARLYLAKAPGFTRGDVDAILPPTGDTLPGLPDERVKNLPPDSDERKLTGKIDEDTLKWYIGRKAINRMGCFGCHDVPGFETAKPIGTALNDWGKKDPERLAFEDADIYVRDHYHKVPLRNDPNDPNKADADWHAENGKPPYEQVYAEAVKHHRREGFLHQKLMEPRSFDFDRVRTWDDRLRMPQFRFARIKQREGESDEAYHARQEFEEAEAREAVMTFILGLVAEPMPLKYLNQPNPDRLAEIKGHQVLDKFNCAGCHQVRPGFYEFKTTPEGLKVLEDSKSSEKNDHVFPGHNAWVGAMPTSADRLTVRGSQPTLNVSDDYSRPMLVIRSTDALRFTGRDGVLRNLPASSNIAVDPDDLVVRADPWGGTFVDLMIQYMKRSEPDADKVRAKVPPPLIREGERVQPSWLYSFLLDPPPVRPEKFMMLRMPKFNMSGEDARAIVNYFSSVSRLTNPGAGVTASFVNVAEREDNYWRTRTAEYIKRLKKEKKYDERVKEMESLWKETLKQRIAEAEAKLDAAKQAVKDAKVDQVKAQKEKDVKELEERIKTWKSDRGKEQLRKEWEKKGAYASDAYKLLTDRNLCLQCHNVGDVPSEQPQAPNLDLTARRLRPEWVKEWIANPDRLFAYKPAMPQNFPNDSLQYQDRFVGKTIDQVIAVRDILMDLPRVEQMPGNRSRAPLVAGGGK